MKLLIINGPNLNFLGKRDQKIYGTLTLDQMEKLLYNESKASANRKVFLLFFQSNHEGALIDYIQKHHDADGLLINPGALTHYSHALADALRDFPGKKVEVHLSDIEKREDFRRISVTKDACDYQISGKKEQSYVEGLRYLLDQLS